MSQSPQPSAQSRLGPGAFVDSAEIHVRAGRGGRGVSSFRHEPFTPRGGPDGGDGGRGGSITVRASAQLTDLSDFLSNRNRRAEDGGNGARKRRHGKQGHDLEIVVPVGTQVIDDSGVVLGDLDVDGATLIVAKGGAGGRGNIHFASAENRAPQMAEPGLPGEERRLRLELKLIADAGLVGKPNAGKSSLLAALSSARPKVGDYAFTTLDPELGVAFTPAGRVVFADIPGLIEGASTGLGLGLRFLRHVERTRVLVFVVDGSAADPWGDLDTVRGEVHAYSPGLAARPALVAFNKVDLGIAPEVRAAAGDNCFFVSALTGEGVSELSLAVETVMRAMPLPEPVVVVPEVKLRSRSPAPPPDVLRERDGFRVLGPTVIRLLARTDFNSEEGLARFQTRLDRLGISKALEEAGAEPGDTVRLGETEFEYQR